LYCLKQIIRDFICFRLVFFSPIRQPTMDMGKYWILLMLMLTVGGKRVIKRPTTLAHFSFLVPEREMLIKIKASVETVQYSILVNFDDQKWSVMSKTVKFFCICI
jgi:hypothetical protein